MAFTMTRHKRAHRWRTVRTLLVATLAFSTANAVCAAGAMAQVKAPQKKQLKPATARSAATAPSEDVQSFSVAADGSVAQQLLTLQVDPADADAAAAAISKALSKPEVKAASSGRAVLEPQGSGQPKRLVSLQLYSNTSLAVELARGTDGTFGYKLAPNATTEDDERVSSVPSTAAAAVPPGPGSRGLVADSVKVVKASPTTLAGVLAPSGANPASLKELTQALAGFTSASAKIDVVQGRTVDGTPRVLVASLGDGKARQSFWWFAPPNQPEGWFDDHGKRLGGTALADPRPGARMSSPFGTRYYYGRKSGSGFHNGIDFEGKVGEPIYAAADGVINHQGWYFNYGRTVKISHADSFESLYAHMSRFADGMGPGTRVRKGDLIGYVGSTGRSTGPHLHFSVIVNGQFVNPQPYISENGGHGALAGETLVAYRQWQGEVKRAADRGRKGGFFGRGDGGAWSTNPFSSSGADRL
jgi:murein DD-endopeptidase MepM/ murein hydrolase activator NlpD